MSSPGGLDRVERMLTLVPWLSRHPGVSISEAAREFGVSADQLEKDLWTLVVSGLPGHGPDQLIDIDFWDDGEIYVRDPQVLEVSMRLSADESTALLVGLRLIAQIADGPTRSAIMEAANRIETALGASDSGVMMQAQPMPESVDLLEQARISGHAVTITYADAATDTVTTRRIWPTRTFSIDDIAYSEAFCELAGAVRTFRWERVRGIEMDGESQSPAAQDIGKGVGDKARSGAVSGVAVVRFSPHVAWAADIHATRSREVSPDGSVLVTMPYFDPHWLVGWVLSIGPGVEIQAPMELREAVVERATWALTPQ